RAAIADHPLASDGSLDQPPDTTKHRSLPSRGCCAFFLRRFFGGKTGHPAVAELARVQARRRPPAPGGTLASPATRVAESRYHAPASMRQAHERSLRAVLQATIGVCSQ